MIFFLFLDFLCFVFLLTSGAYFFGLVLLTNQRQEGKLISQFSHTSFTLSHFSGNFCESLFGKRECFPRCAEPALQCHGCARCCQNHFYRCLRQLRLRIVEKALLKKFSKNVYFLHLGGVVWNSLLIEISNFYFLRCKKCKKKKSLTLLYLGFQSDVANTMEAKC